MKISKILPVSLIVLTLASCVQPQYGGSIGQRSAQHNASNSDPRSMVSEARLAQDRRRRANVVEDSRARRELREHDRDEQLGGLKTAREGVGLVRDVLWGGRSAVNVFR